MTESSENSPFRNALSKNPNRSVSLNKDWLQKAEEELNETPETYKRELTALTLMVKSKNTYILTK